MTDSIRRIGEVDLARITRVPRSTRSSWSKNGWISKSRDRRFDERAAVEVAIFSELVAALESRVAHAAWLDAADHVLSNALEGSPGDHQRLDLLVNCATAGIDVVESDEEIGEIVGRTVKQPHVRIPLARWINDVREAYWRYARLDKANDRRKRKGALGPGERSREDEAT